MLAASPIYKLRNTTSSIRVSAMIVFLVLLSASAAAQTDNVEIKNPYINRIIINGNDYFSEKDLKRQMYTKESTFFSVFRKPRLRMDFLQRDIAILEAYYHANGFLEATVTLGKIEKVKDQAFVDITIEIRENDATRVETVSFETKGAIAQKELREGLILDPGVPYNPTFLDADIYTIKKKYFEKGLLAVNVEDSVAVEERSVQIFYSIEPGPVINIRDITIRGNELTKTSIVDKELRIKSGDPFRLSQVIETQRNLFETGLFTEAEIIPENLNTELRTVDIVVRLRERKPAYVEAGFGVGNILGSRVVGEWGHNNIFGTGRRVRFKIEYSFGLFEGGRVDFEKLDPRVKYYRYDGEFYQRHVFGSKILLGLNAFLEKDATVENISILTRGASIGGRRRLSRNTNLLVQLSQERIERQTPEAADDKSTSNLISSTISHDTRDFIMDPRHGGYRDVRVQVAGGILGGDNDFYTITTTFQRYFRRKSGLIFAVRVRPGFADAFGASSSTGVPIENRYFTGGGNSIRGFDENSLGPRDIDGNVIGGRALLVTNAEIRFPFPFLARWRFSGSFFFDGGNVWSSLGSIKPKNFKLFTDDANVTQEDYRYSMGLGIRYNTPVGPIRLDFGVPLKKQPGLDETPRFHLSLGQIF